MNALELRKIVEDYERSSNIYMNFSVDEKGIWGLPEGNKTQHLLSEDRISKYELFLIDAVKHYQNMARFFSNDASIGKKVNKYQMYLKRLNNAKKKVKVA
jgi:hypothetical protein